MELVSCSKCGSTMPHTLEYFVPVDNRYKKKAERNPSSCCIACAKEAKRKYNQSRKEARLRAKEDNTEERRRVHGRIEETPTKEGKIVRFGEDWKPLREEKRYKVPGLLGYQSGLAGIL